jgi:hypothetical protein
MVNHYCVSIFKRIVMSITVVLLTQTMALADSRSSGWHQKYERASKLIKQRGINYVGNALKTDKPKRLDRYSTEISSKYLLSDKTLITLIQFKNGYEAAFRQQLSPEAKRLNHSIVKIIRFGKFSRVCNNPINRAAIDKGMTFYYEVEDTKGSLIASVDVNKSSCAQWGF